MSAPALRFPTPDWQPAPLSPNPLPALALMLAVVGCVVLWTVGFWAGRRVEQGTQLGAILALSQELEVLEAAVARSDSGMRMIARLAQAPRRPQNRAPAPRQATISLPAPTIPTLPLPQIRP